MEAILDHYEPVDISRQIPADFSAKIESKKWAERRDALEALQKVLTVPRIKNADFNELVRILKKTIAKDSNIVVATSAAKCLYLLAIGLRGDFSPHSCSSLAILFDKFKEKKPNINSVMREAADAAYMSTNIENALETITQFLDNKNPQIKSEMALFLARLFAKYPAQVLNKKTLRPLINSLVKTLSDMDSTVRDNSAMAIGTAMKVTGEKLMMTLIADVEPIKISKIKEFCDKAVIESTPTRSIVHESNGTSSEPDQTENIVVNDEDDDDQAFEAIEPIDISRDIPADFSAKIESKKWAERRDALEALQKVLTVPRIKNADFNELVRILKKTIAKDSNIVVATSAAKCLYLLAIGLRGDFSSHADSSLAILFEKFKEKKPNVNSVMREAADAVFISTNLENTLETISQFLDNKNPQIKSEMALFLARLFAKYPAQVLNKKTLRPLINSLVKTLSDMDSTVRDNSAMAIGTAMKVTGEKLMMTLIADVEPIKVSKIKEFCDKAEVKKVPQALLKTMNPTVTTNNSAPMNPPTIAATIKRPDPKVKRTGTIIKRTLKPADEAPAKLPPEIPVKHAPETPVKPTLKTPAKPIFNKPNIEAIVLRLVSESDDNRLESLATIEKMLTTDFDLIRSHISPIIYLLCVQLTNNFDVRTSECLMKLFARRQLVAAASQTSIRFLLVQIFTLTQASIEDETASKRLNNIASVVMDGFEPTAMLRILTGMLNEPSSTFIVEPIKKAIIRSMRSFK